MYFIKYYSNVNPDVTYQESRMIVQAVLPENIPENGTFVQGSRNDMECFVQSGRKVMGCFVKNSMGVLSRVTERAWDVLSRVTKRASDVLSRVTKTACLWDVFTGWQDFVKCFVRGVKKGH